MALVWLSLSPHFVSLKLEQGSYGASETRLDFNVSLDDPRRFIDQDGSLLSEDSWSLRVRDIGSSGSAEDGEHGAGSLRYRSPSPSANESAGTCVIEVGLFQAVFASLLAVCISGRLPERLYIEVDGLDDSAGDRLAWNRNLQSSLTVASISLSVQLANT